MTPKQLLNLPLFGDKSTLRDLLEYAHNDGWLGDGTLDMGDSEELTAIMENIAQKLISAVEDKT